MRFDLPVSGPEEMSRAALIYQHATTDRDRSIADAMSALVDLDRRTDTEDNSTDDEDDEDDDDAAGTLVPVA